MQSLCVGLVLLILPGRQTFAQLDPAPPAESFQYRQGGTDYSALCAGLIVGAALYGVLAPEPDQFRISYSDYYTVPNAEETDYHYYVRTREVSAEEFFITMDEEIERHNRAERKRKAAKTRDAGILGLAVASYLFMLADTLWLKPGRTETRHSRFRLQIVPETGDPTGSRGIGLRMCVGFR